MGDETRPDTASAAAGPGDGVLIARWRLILGRVAEDHGLVCGDDERLLVLASLLDFLFGGPEGGGAGAPASGPGGGRTRPGARGGARSSRAGGRRKGAGTAGDAGGERQGGLGPSTWTVPRWVESVRELFPVQAKEVMERELVKRRGIASLLEEPKLLERVEPNVGLVKVLLTHKSLLNAQTREVARRLIDRVVQEIKGKLKLAVEPSLSGALRHDRHSPRRVFRNLDLGRTIRRNLQNYDEPRGRLLVDRLFFYAAERKRRPWHVIVLVDQSGSMLESAVFSAIMASIFAEIPAVRTSLVLFDTEVLDLSDQVGQPVDVLLSVQLGGGTHIARALQYAQQLVTEPRRTIVVLISDFHEGADPGDLVRQAELLADTGVRMIGLAALGYDSCPEYNQRMASLLRKVGMDVLVCTPEHLAECMARIIRG